MRKVAVTIAAVLAFGLMAFSCETEAPVVKPVKEAAYCKKTYTDKVACEADAKCKWEVQGDGAEKCDNK